MKELPAGDTRRHAVFKVLTNPLMVQGTVLILEVVLPSVSMVIFQVLGAQT